MKVHVRYFASIREALDRGAETVETRAETLAALRDELIARGGPYAESLARGRAVRRTVASPTPWHKNRIQCRGVSLSMNLASERGVVLRTCSRTGTRSPTV